MYCPECKTEWQQSMTNCPVCSHELSGATGSEWTLLGSVSDKMSADFARETLLSYEIPAVVISKSGFFGQAGLTFNNFYQPGSGLFEISIPSEHVPEATEVMNMVLGDRWQKGTD